jgi:hypothetical protein
VNRKSKQEVLAGLGAAPRELPDVPHAELLVEYAERDRILATAMQHLSRHNIAYVPLDVEEDIEISYQRDDLDGFRETVRGWMRQLRGGLVIFRPELVEKILAGATEARCRVARSNWAKRGSSPGCKCSSSLDCCICPGPPRPRLWARNALITRSGSQRTPTTAMGRFGWAPTRIL